MTMNKLPVAPYDHSAEVVPHDFIRHIVSEDISSAKHQRIVTRFPPEPNGYLHLGHAKSIFLNFSIAQEFGGVCRLRFDDTNPETESQEYIDNITKDVAWLGFQWQGEVRYASQYFEQLYAWACELIDQGLAYVDLQSIEQIRENRGSFSQLGKNSPYRETSVAENRARFEAMRRGDYAEGAAVLRAKIDMEHANLNMRDPVLYRVLHVTHHQTGEQWKIYPMYDYAHPLSDAIEAVTHSLCTLEFEDHRPFYDWVVANVSTPSIPRQIEFSRLNVDYMLTSKRKLKQLVDKGVVTGWDDPRMPTIAGMRRRGYPPEALRDFCQRIGVSKHDGVVDIGLLEFCIRKQLETTAPRAMAVIRPLKIILTNLPETQVLSHARHPHVDMGERSFPISSEIWIDQQDFSLDPPKGYKRLVLGGEVRLRHAYIIRACEAVYDAGGQLQAVRCEVDLSTLGKNPEDRKVKGVIHWVSEAAAVPAQFRLYERLFTSADPEAGDDVMDNVNPHSINLHHGYVEPALAQSQAGERFQFEREGYYIADAISHTTTQLVFNQIVDLRDTWKPS